MSAPAAAHSPTDRGRPPSPSWAAVVLLLLALVVQDAYWRRAAREAERAHAAALAGLGEQVEATRDNTHVLQVELARVGAERDALRRERTRGTSELAMPAAGSGAATGSH